MPGHHPLDNRQTHPGSLKRFVSVQPLKNFEDLVAVRRAEACALVTRWINGFSALQVATYFD